MALGHADVGTALSRTEWQSSGTGAHVINGQQAGDLIYASTTSALARLAVGGTAGMVLTSNASIPVWTTSVYATDLILGEDSQTAIDFGTANEIDFKADNAARLTLTASSLYPVTNNQIDLGTSSLEFKDAFFDGTVTADGFAGPLTGAVTGTASVATLASTVTVIDSTDASSYIAMFDSATGSLAAKTDAGLTYNATSGMLTATGLTGPLTGVAATATALASARTINGVSFDGTGNITVTAAGSTLSDTVPVSKGGTGATSLADKAVLISQDTGTDTVGAVALTTSGQLIIGGSSGPAAATLTEGSNITISNGDGTISIAAAGAGTPSTITVADTTDTSAYVALFDSATGDLGPKTDAGITYNAGTGILTATGFAGPITGNVTGNTSGSSGSTTGNAATATALATGRTIGGVSFDGTANIAVTLAATATALASARTINGVSFDGTGNITVTAAGSTLSDTVPISKGGTGATSLDNLITLAHMAHGTDGNLITYGTDTAPAFVATGDDGQVLTSAGAGQPPAFEDLSGVTTGKAIAMALIF